MHWYHWERTIVEPDAKILNHPDMSMIQPGVMFVETPLQLNVHNVERHNIVARNVKKQIGTCIILWNSVEPGQGVEAVEEKDGKGSQDAARVLKKKTSRSKSPRGRSKERGFVK